MVEKFIVAGIGELLWDMLPSGKQPGGAPGNFAFHAMQSGCESYVVSAIGNDLLGEELRKNIQQLGITDQYIQENEFPTGTVSVELDENGHPDYTIHENVAWDHILWNRDLKKLANQLDAVCYGSLAQRKPESQHSIKSFLAATRPDCIKVFDINLRQNYYSEEIINESLILSDVLKLNEDELPVVSAFYDIRGNDENQLSQILKHFNLDYIVYTMGSQGSMIMNSKELSVERVPRIQVVDTVGAGDSFTAVFIAGILQGIPLNKIHKKATEIAAYVCTQKGATPKLTQKIF